MNDGVDPGSAPRAGVKAADPRPGPNPADTQKQIEQGLSLLAQVRSAVQDSPEAKQQLQRSSIRCAISIPNVLR